MSKTMSKTRAKPDARVLDRLAATIKTRKRARPETSYTALLLSKGPRHIAKKLGEESAEAIIEAVAQNRTGLVRESADVLYHLLVLWTEAGIAPGRVWAELARREGVSGIEEKRRRRAKR
jgi:phosphoribosyl-ATP pyrophosphohydrolase